MAQKEEMRAHPNVIPTLEEWLIKSPWRAEKKTKKPPKGKTSEEMELEKINALRKEAKQRKELFKRTYKTQKKENPPKKPRTETDNTNNNQAQIDPDVPTNLDDTFTKLFDDLKSKTMLEIKKQLDRERERHESEKKTLLSEMNSLKELVATHEKSIEGKDQIIANLTNALKKQEQTTFKNQEALATIQHGEEKDYANHESCQT